MWALRAFFGSSAGLYVSTAGARPRLWRFLPRGNRERVAAQFVSGEAIVMAGLKATSRYLSDVENPFRQEGNFWYMTGVNKPGCYFVLDVSTKKLTLLVPFLSLDDAVWFGKTVVAEEERAFYGVDDVILYKDEAGDESVGFHLKKLCANAKKVHLLNDDMRSIFENVSSSFCADFDEKIVVGHLLGVLDETRLIKSLGELVLLRRSVEIAARAHRETMIAMRKNHGELFEYHVESEFLYQASKFGTRVIAYGTIAAAGENAAILHYGQNDGRVPCDALICCDAGIEYQLYASDITRSFPVGGKFSKEQKEIYGIVLDAQLACLRMLKPDVEFADCYDVAIRIILQGLIRLGLVVPNGQSEGQLLVLGVPQIFMPHGLGHSMGIDVHDVAGKRKSGHPNRLNRALKKGMVLTVEPGLYFVKMLLEKAYSNPDVAKHLNQEKILEYTKKVGGVRIEDDLLITEDGYENLVDLNVCPKSIEEIELLLA